MTYLHKSPPPYRIILLLKEVEWQGFDLRVVFVSWAKDPAGSGFGIGPGLGSF
jgi:hypothetical protein